LGGEEEGKTRWSGGDLIRRMGESMIVVVGNRKRREEALRGTETRKTGRKRRRVNRIEGWVEESKGR